MNDQVENIDLSSKFKRPRKREGQSEIRAFLEIRERNQKKYQLVELEKNAGQKVDHSDI